MSELLNELAERWRRRIVGIYKPKRNRHFRFKDEMGRDFPRWMRNIMLGGFLEQGWAAYEQPGGRRIASGKWGERLLRLADGTITTASALRARAATISTDKTGDDG